MKQLPPPRFTGNGRARRPRQAAHASAHPEGSPYLRTFIASLLLLLAALPVHAADTAAPAQPPAARDEVLVIIGAPGEDTFAPGFAAAAKNWQTACERAKVACTVIGLDEKKDAEAAPTDKDRIQAWIKNLDLNSAANAWIAYIGHGTFDGKDARMNLRGPDLLPAEMAAWLKPLKRPVIFIDGGSASYPFMTALYAPNRIIISATRSGAEINYCRFGEYFAAALVSDDSDLDQDGQISLLEAFVAAAQKVKSFYDDNNRLMSEHALIDDNGDPHPTPADFFKGTRVVKRPAGGGMVSGSKAKLIALAPSDAERAMTSEQIQQRAALEQQLEKLHDQKTKMPEADYYAALEKLLRQLAALYVPAGGAASPATATGGQPTPPPTT
jgi:hypothetical protein